MCGIIGVVGKEPISDRARLSIGRDSMAHRGPDDYGEWWSNDGRVGFGHRRLAIIDLSPAAHQPMVDASDSLALVFNGEMYNFRSLREALVTRGHSFVSQSDTEVVLKAYEEWGADFVVRLEGMFALALYDSRKGELLLARDRVGEKPLFYFYDGSTFAFSSELKGLLACMPGPREIDVSSLDCFLGMGYVPGDRCILRGVRKLSPAHFATFDLSAHELRVERYWRLPPPAQADLGLPELLDELESTLQGAVARQLVADVPVGVLLSGGLDSSLVTAMAARAARQVNTYTIGFPGHASVDESRHARLIAAHFGTNHVELSASEADPGLLHVLARQFDEPIIDSSMIPTFLVSGLVRQHCAVALGGDGGDELFGGYQHYDRLLKLAAVGKCIPRAVRRGVGAAALRTLPPGYRGRNWAAAIATDFTKGVPQIASYFDRRTRVALVPALHNLESSAEDVWATSVYPNGDLIDRATRTDFSNYLPEDILVKVDRASMLASLEVRAPFLDPSVVEFAFAKVPSHRKVKGNRRKILLAELAARVLPGDMDRARKHGFVVPLSTWLRNTRWREDVRAILLESETAFERSVVEKLWEGQDRGRQNSERLFGLALFELWRRHYDVSVPVG